jgi:hypothetical protein
LVLPFSFVGNTISKLEKQAARRGAINTPTSLTRATKDAGPMTQADRVYITPPTNTSAIDHPIMFPPRDPTRRRFLAAAAGASVVSAGTLAAATLTAPSVLVAVTISRQSRPDPVFALIAEKRAADAAHCEAIGAEEKAEEHGIGLDEASDRALAACHAAHAIDWKLATTLPTTLAGIAAVLRFANEHEDAGGEWPNTDAVGPDGWHYQLRATMAAAIEALIKAPAGKAVLS